MYLAQFNPPSVREAQPYGYTSAEWQKMKKEYQRKKAEWDVKNREKFHEWQAEYLKGHPDLAAELSSDSKKSAEPRESTSLCATGDRLSCLA